MIHRKILIIAPYPISNPQHGGQKRVRAIYDHYKTIFTDVKFVGVFHSKYYADYDPTDCPVEDKELIKQIEESPFLGDALSGEAIFKDKNIKQKITELLITFKPDIVQIEQVFPYVGLSRLLEEIGMSPKLIMSSHNIESKLKYDVLQGLKSSSRNREQIVNKIAELEKKLSQSADLVIAVSKSDLKQHKAMGAKKCVVIPNGVYKIIPTTAALEHWKKFKKSNNIAKPITFIGSAHPPNLFGFQEMIGENLDFLPDKSHLLLAGSVAEYFQEIYEFWKTSHKSFWDKTIPLGRLSDDNLAGLVLESDVLLLPITSGGGSNLKTAEAILSGQKVVATSYAFRAFEQYQHLPNIYVADSRSEFKKKILFALDSEKVERTLSQQKLSDKVQWHYCLRPLTYKLEVLAHGHVGGSYKYLGRQFIRSYRRVFG